MEFVQPVSEMFPQFFYPDQPDLYPRLFIFQLLLLFLQLEHFGLGGSVIKEKQLRAV